MAEMLTIDEVMDRLKIGRSTLYRWVDEGKLKPYKAGGRRTFFKKEDVEKLFQPVEEETPPPAEQHLKPAV
jgi:excisionase family DNA binding protein